MIHHVSVGINGVSADLLQDNSSPMELDNPLSGSICFELRKTSVTVMTAMSREFAKWDLKPSEANLLKYIGANPGCTQNEIARSSRSSPTNLVPLIARLEREGLVERIAGGGRAIALSVSKKGKAVLEGVNDAYQRLEDRLASNLTPEELALALEAFRSIRKAAHRHKKSCGESQESGR